MQSSTAVNQLCILTLAAALFFIPFGLFQNAALGGLTVAKMAIPALFVLLVLHLRTDFNIHPLLWLYLAFVVSTTSSLILSDSYTSILISFVGYAVLFQVLINSVHSIAALRTLMTAYVFGLLAVSAAGIIAFLGADIGTLFGNAMMNDWYGLPIMLGTQINPNGFASFYVVGIPLTMMLFLNSETPASRWFFLLVIAVLAFCLTMTFSRSGIVAAALATMLIHHFSRNRRLFTISLIVKTLITLAVIYWYMKYPYISLLKIITGESSFYNELARYLMALGSDNFFHLEPAPITEPPRTGNSVLKNKVISESIRLLVLGHQWNAFWENPVFGMGYGNFANYLDNAMGLKINAHNVFTGIAIEYGVFALILFLGLLAFGYFRILGVIHKTDQRETRLVVAGVLSAIAALLFHGLFHEIYVNLTLWFMIAIAGMAHKMKESE